MDEHYVPEGWDELDRGLCPHCGQTVTWNEEAERWDLDPTLTVLVLTKDEFDKVLDRSGESDSDIAYTLEWQYDISRRLDE